MDLVDDIRTRLTVVRDPELQASIVELGMVGPITVDEGGHVTVTVALTTAACPLRATIDRDVRAAVLATPGVHDVTITMGVLDAAAKAELLRVARRHAQERAPATSIPRQAPVVMISSGKGGVGKSTVTAGLARALAQSGRHVGVLDADIWGFSLARLLELEGEIGVKGGRMMPVQRPEGRGTLSLLSMGHLAQDGDALLWRGLMVQKAVAQFIEDADWSAIDILLIDTPPGTGDIVMTLSRLLPHLGQIIVTTPASDAAVIAGRAADFARKSNLRLLGVVETMSSFPCECGHVHAPFGTGGGQRVAEQFALPLLGSLPFASGTALTDALATLADTVAATATDLVPVGCTARLLDALDHAVAGDDPTAPSA